MLRNITTKHTYLLKKHGNHVLHFRFAKCYTDAVISSYIGFKLFVANIFDAS